MIVKTNLLENMVNCVDRMLREHVNFVDNTKKTLKIFEKKIKIFFVVIVSLFLFFLFLKKPK